MGQSTIPVDLRNPGQVFACLGFLEAADILCGGAEGRFDWEGESVFYLDSENSEHPVSDVLQFIESADVIAVAPPVDELSDNYGLLTCHSTYPTFPQPEPKASILPVLLCTEDGRSVPITHFAELSSKTAYRDNCKFWGGAGGYSAAARAEDLKNAFSKLGDNERKGAENNPFEAPAILSNGFRLEMRRDYVAIDVGFSPNDHNDIAVQGYPLVELLAAIGLEHARPKKVDRFKYQYAAWNHFLPSMLARTALGGDKAASTIRRFSMALKEVNRGGDRSIYFVTEEAE